MQLCFFRVLFGCLLLSASLASCRVSDGVYFGRVPEVTDPKHLRWCNSGEPQYLDPALVSSTTGIPIVNAMFDGLTDYDQNGDSAPSLATRWEIGPDQRRFTFQLRKDAKFSDGTPITSRDFAYHIIRILHPLTGSGNAEPLGKLRNGVLYNGNRVRRVLRDVPPFRAGDIVELVRPQQKSGDSPTILPDTNIRRSTSPLPLRDRNADASAAYAIVPANRDVTLIEYGGDKDSWAYVHWGDDDGVYGWVPRSKLDVQPNQDVSYQVRGVDKAQLPRVDYSLEQLDEDRKLPRREGRITGKDLVMLPDLLGIRTPDPYTLILETVGPLPSMMDQTSDRIFRPVPRHVVSRYPRRWTKPEHIVTSGPFHMAEWNIRDYIRLKKSSTYWDRAEVRVDTITVFSISDAEASANYYYYGGCDGSNQVPSAYIPLLDGTLYKRKPFRDYTRFDWIGVYAYLVNTKKFPNVHFRRALAYATDRSHFPRILKGGQEPTYQWTPGTPVSKLSADTLATCGITRKHLGVAMMVTPSHCYVPPQGLDFNEKRARAELAIARKEMGDKFPDTITVKFNTMEAHKLIAEQIQQQWKRVLGIRVELESQEWKTFLSDTRNGQYDVARMGWVSGTPDPETAFLAPLFKCDSPSNRTKFCDPEFDRLFAELERTADRKKRLALTAQAEKIMIEAVPVIPMYLYQQYHLQKPYLRGMKINKANRVLFKHAWLDPDWRDHR